MVAPHILLIDDHAMFRTGLRMVLSAHLPEAQVFDAGSLNEAMRGMPNMPDVILLDIKLPGINGLDGIAMLKRKWPQVPILILYSQDEPEVVRVALTRGAAGFASKAQTANEIVALINQLLCGDFTSAATSAPRGFDAARLQLTQRQCEVLDLMCQGMPNKLIARQLKLSENTVRGHVQGILALLQVSSRSEAAYVARRRGLIG
jgi:DNA-binding NarL/FixJ family response regulator